ncbi:M28 family peptidase, partial [Bacteroidota bacterium]
AEKAIEYICKNLRSYNVKPFFQNGNSYTSDFIIDNKKQNECYIENEHGRIIQGEDFMELYCNYYGEEETELIFIGYGQESDYENITVTGKLVTYFTGQPGMTDYIEDLEIQKRMLASEKGAVGTILFDMNDDEVTPYINSIKRIFSQAGHYFHLSPREAKHQPRIIVSVSSALAKLFGINRDAFYDIKEKLDKGEKLTTNFRTKIKMKTSYDIKKTYDGKNLIGMVEGSSNKDEFIILSAHYDHLGMDNNQVYNGADDNATGVSALLEIADAFSKAISEGHYPKRNILFFFTGAEELWMTGSQYFINQELIPNKKIIANINIDMIGREDANRPDLKNFVYVYCSLNGKNDLNELLENSDKINPSGLDFEKRDSYKGSDHYSFERAGIPVIAYSTGHSKDYHQTSDIASRIRFGNFHTITQSVFTTTWELANHPKSIRRIVSK